MAKNDAVCKTGLSSEGNASFPSQCNASYRYKVKSKTDTVRFWLEDRKSKKQWYISQFSNLGNFMKGLTQSKKLKLSDFVDANNTIPQATMQDYVKGFVRCLAESTSKEDGECIRDLVSSSTPSGGEWILKFATALTMFDSVWFPVYQFTLTPIPLEPIDILAAQLRDMQDEVAALQGEKLSKSDLKRVKRTLTTTTDVLHGKLLNWKFAGDCRRVCSIEEGGVKVRFLHSGEYLIQLKLNHTTYTDDSCHVELQRDGEVFQPCTFYTTRTSTAKFCHSQAVKMAEGEMLSVLNCVNNYISVGSTLSITLLE
uniref:Uncharacterized protein n=1 Tax=Globisporangium ultimum (strain ATCC 200006 / CBS 805.95 / DAOM BR144) TaxID=431595 RepID=K3X5W8_GLOUD